MPAIGRTLEKYEVRAKPIRQVLEQTCRLNDGYLIFTSVGSCRLPKFHGQPRICRIQITWVKCTMIWLAYVVETQSASRLTSPAICDDSAMP